MEKRFRCEAISEVRELVKHSNVSKIGKNLVVMRQYTTPDQTAKLIELGFEKPKNRLVKQRFDRSTSSWIVVGEEGDYSIGELLSLLPISFETDNDDTSWLEIEAGAVWSVSYSSFGFIDYDCERKEHIDALYDMIIILKEEGVI